MLIEKLRCESICLLSSHYAAHSVNITPEENSNEGFQCFLSSSSSHFLCVVMMIHCDREKTNQDCALEFRCKRRIVMMWQHHIHTHSSFFPLTGEAGFVSLVSINDTVTGLRLVTWLIWLPWKCALAEMSYTALRLQRSHRGGRSTPLEISLMQSEVTAWDQVQVQITLPLSDSLLTPFAALTAQPIIYTCKQVLTHIHPCFSS